jgi:putative FmdB family regulatory protein
MPTYEFQCKECGLRFEAVGDATKSEDPRECHCCGHQAERIPHTEVNFHFDAKTSGLTPQNTGVSGIDYEVDKIIANDAEEKWDQINARDESKRRILRDYPDTTKEDLSREPDGSYSVMPKDIKKDADRIRTINNVAMQLIKRKRKKL